MADERDEEERLREVALQNAQSILAARRRAEDALRQQSEWLRVSEGHQVVLHARSRERASALDDLASRSAGVIVGDLGSAVETRSIAAQVNAIGRMDAVIHNAGISSTKGPSPTPEGHATILAVNTLAPYMLTALIERPQPTRVPQ